MAVGSLGSWYTSGSLYRKFSAQTTGQKLNRSSVAAFDREVAAAGSLIFGQEVERSYGLSELAVKSMQKRTLEQMQGTIKAADTLQSTALNILA